MEQNARFHRPRPIESGITLACIQKISHINQRLSRCNARQLIRSTCVAPLFTMNRREGHCHLRIVLLRPNGTLRRQYHRDNYNRRSRCRCHLRCPIFLRRLVWLLHCLCRIRRCPMCICRPRRAGDFCPEGVLCQRYLPFRACFCWLRAVCWPLSLSTKSRLWIDSPCMYCRPRCVSPITSRYRAMVLA